MSQKLSGNHYMSFSLTSSLISPSCSVSCSDILYSTLATMGLFWLFSLLPGFMKDAWDRGEWVRLAVLALLLSSQICHSFPSFYCFSTHHQRHLPTCATQPENCVRDGYQKNGAVLHTHTSVDVDDTEGNNRFLLLIHKLIATTLPKEGSHLLRWKNTHLNKIFLNMKLTW